MAALPMTKSLMLFRIDDPSARSIVISAMPHHLNALFVISIVLLGLESFPRSCVDHRHLWMMICIRNFFPRVPRLKQATSCVRYSHSLVHIL